MKQEQQKLMQKCRECNIHMFPVYTPRGGDTSTCPFCGKDYCNDKNDNGWFFPYCSTCKIIFDEGCKHSEQGCTDSVFNAAIMTGFITNDKTHSGMLIFDSDDKATQFQQDVIDGKVYVKFNCTCNGTSHNCPKTRGVKNQKCNYKTNKYKIS